jgi:hypothetical protein
VWIERFVDASHCTLRKVGSTDACSARRGDSRAGR